MPPEPRQRPSSVLTSVLAAAGIVLALASCSSITPLGPTREPAHGGVQPTPVGTVREMPPPGQPAQPASYGFMVGVPAAQVTAVIALIKRAYDAQGALGVSVDGKLWKAPQVAQPFSGQQLQIDVVTRSQAVQLYHLLVPAS